MFKKILSYIFYFEQSRISLHNGKVRVILREGKKILNTDHANYSFGSLHRIMRFALGNITLGTDEDILLLGLGGGSVIDIVRNDLHLSNKLVAVDIDPVIIEIARQEFALDSYENTEIICADAYEYIEKEAGEYGLIIIDLFIDNKVPEKFYGDIFWGHISRILSQNGQIIFNTMIENNSRELFDTLTQNLENKGFLVTIHEKVAGSNVMMIMKRK
ncbi:MAG: fused MFS/spermidine synthase [Candidatus Gracilibacteria bacterium]